MVFPLGNHIGIFKAAGYEVRKFSYWDEKTCGMDWENYKRTLNDAPEGSVFVLHGVAHNPTGVDPTQQQWMEIATIMKVGLLMYQAKKKSFIIIVSTLLLSYAIKLVGCVDEAKLGH